MKKTVKAATANPTNSIVEISTNTKILILETLKNAPVSERTKVQKQIMKTYKVSMKEIKQWKLDILKLKYKLNSTDDSSVYVEPKPLKNKNSIDITNTTDMADNINTANTTNTTNIEEVDPEIFKLRKQIGQHKSEISKLRIELKDALKEAHTSSAIKKLIHGVNKDFNELPEWLSPCDVNEESTSKNMAYMMFSDIHYSEVVDTNEVNGVNDYNKQISKDRIFYTINKFIEIMQGDFNRGIEACILALNGDLISGDIKLLLETNEGSVSESLLELAEILIQCIEKLEKAFGKVFVPCTVGNHGRTSIKPKIKRKVFDSYEYIMYHIIAKHFNGNKNVIIHVPDSSELFYSVYGVNILQMHGDVIHGGNGIGGIYVPLFKYFYKKQSQYSSMKKPDIDLLTIGHFHTYSTLSNVLVNGSIVGFSELAKQWTFGYEDPQQAVMIINSHKGITYHTSIKCNGYEKINNIKDGIRLL